MKIFLAEIEAYSQTNKSVVIHRFASGLGYSNGADFYPPRIENPATFSRSMGEGLGGKASTSTGELTLINNDGGLNYLANDYFDGRTLTLKWGDSTAAYSTFQTVLVATVETVALELERVSIRLRDKATTLDKPFSEVKYRGDNTLPLGVEGTADDIKDQNKPRIMGRIALTAPVLVNSSKLIYQVNDGAVDEVLQVYDGGAYLSKVSGYTDLNDLYANAPASGCWRALPSLGLFRLGSMPVNQVSCSVAEKWDYLKNSAAGIISRVLAEKGISSLVATDLTALDRKNAGSLGIVIEAGETTSSILDRICESIGAFWWFDALGRFRVARFDAPTGTPKITFTDDEIIELERQPEAQLPLWEVVMRADRNYSVQDKKSLAGVVPADRVAWYENEYRDQKVSTPTLKTSRLLADTVTYESAINGIATASAEAKRRQSLYGKRRDVVNLTVANPTDVGIDLGDVISVKTSRFGYSAGYLMTVISVRVDYERNILDLIAWG